MNEKITIRRFAETDAETVQNIIHRGLREINGKDYPARPWTGVFRLCF